jgi:hypothetical protein
MSIDFSPLITAATSLAEVVQFLLGTIGAVAVGIVAGTGGKHVLRAIGVQIRNPGYSWSKSVRYSDNGWKGGNVWRSK